MPTLTITIDLEDCVPENQDDSPATITHTVANALRKYASTIDASPTLDHLDANIYRNANTRTRVLKIGEATLVK